MPDQDNIQLQEQDRKKLYSIVSQMVQNKESDDNIKAVVSYFKSKYAVKKKEPAIPSVQDGSKSPSSGEGKTSLYQHLFGKEPLVNITETGGLIDKATKSQQKEIPIDYNPLKGVDIFGYGKENKVPELMDVSGKRKKEDIAHNQEISKKAKQVKDNFYNASLTGDDIDFIKKGNPDILPYESGYSNDDYATLVNNKTQKLKELSDLPVNKSVSESVLKLNDVEKKIEGLNFDKKAALSAFDPSGADKFQSKINELQNQREFLKKGIDVAFSTKLPSYKKDIISAVEKTIGSTIQDNFSESIKRKVLDESGKPYVPVSRQSAKEIFGDKKEEFENGLYDYKTMNLTSKGIELVNKITKQVMDGKNDIVAKAYELGGKAIGDNTLYGSISKAVIDELNTTIPVKHNQIKAANEYVKNNPSFKPIKDSESDISNIFSEENIKSAEAIAKTTIDVDRIKIKKEFENRIRNNTEAQKIISSYDEKVKGGFMTQEIADKNILTELSTNPKTKSILNSRKQEEANLEVIGKGMIQSYLQKGLSKINKDLIIYNDGSIGIKGMSKSQSDKLISGYKKSQEDSYNETIDQITKGAENRAEEIVQKKGLLMANMERSFNNILGGLTSWAYTNIGVGGDLASHFEAKKQTEDISRSSTQQATEGKGVIASLADPNWWAAQIGEQAPIVGGGMVVSALTEGEGLPEYLSSLANSGFFATIDAAQTYDDLLNNGYDKFGHKITSAEAGAGASSIFKKELPLLWGLGYLHTHAVGGKGIVAPSKLRTEGELALGAGFNIATMQSLGFAKKTTEQQVEGLPQTGFVDYALSEEGMGAIAGALMFAPMDVYKTFSKHANSVKVWNELNRSADADVKNNRFYNNAIQQALGGNSGVYQDAIKLRLLNKDFEGKEEEDNLKKSLDYSRRLEKNIEAGRIARGNINGLYAAHNLTLSDLHNEFAKQNEDNKALSDFHKKESNRYKEEGYKALTGDAKFHYMVDTNDMPVFITDKSLETLTKNGEIKKWMDSGTIKDVIKSDDESFSAKFKEQMYPSSDEMPKIESAVIEINGKIYEGKNHAEAILKAKEAGEDITKIDRQADGRFRLSDGSIISRDEAKSLFGERDSEKLIPQDEKADEANKEYAKIKSSTEYKKNIRDDYFAKADFFTPEEKEKFQSLDEEGKDKMIDDKRAELSASKEPNIHNENFDKLNQRAKDLGLEDVNSIRNLNSQYASDIANGKEVPDGVKEILEDYGKHQQDVAALRNEKDIATLNDDNFSKWIKTNEVERNDTGTVLRIEDLDMAAKRIRILNERGETRQAAKELQDLKNSTKKTNITLEDYQKNTDEEGTQKDVDELNNDNKEFNDKLKTSIEEAQQPLKETKSITPTVSEPFKDVENTSRALSLLKDEDFIKIASKSGKLEFLQEDDNGELKPCAEKGITTARSGKQWELVKEIEGDSHASGGVDVNVKGKQVNAEGGELKIQNEKGEVAIIPKDKREEVLSLIENGKHEDINKIVSELPTNPSVAEDGGKYGGSNKIDPQIQEKINYFNSPAYKKRLVDIGVKNPDKLIQDRINELANTKLATTVLGQAQTTTTTDTSGKQVPTVILAKGDTDVVKAHELGHVTGGGKETKDVYDPFEGAPNQMSPAESWAFINRNKNISQQQKMEYWKRYHSPDYKGNGNLTHKYSVDIPADVEVGDTHDISTSENKADLDALRYLFHKEGLTKEYGENITPDVLKKAAEHSKIKNEPHFKRMIANFGEEGIVKLNNIIAANKKNNTETQA